MDGKSLNVWWMKNDNNFGDLLTPYILNYFSINYQYVDFKRADALCVGSILDKSKPNQLILGSGIIDESLPICNTSNFKFVRGPLTRKHVLKAGGICPEIYGDAALLLPMFCDESKKEYDIGIVPHFVDYKLVKKKYPKYNVINVKNENPLTVAKEITKCRHIISSSLHGIIAAHAYGIPAAWVSFSNRLYGSGIKFLDYFESVNTNPTKSTIDDPIFLKGNIPNLNRIIDIFKSI